MPPRRPPGFCSTSSARPTAACCGPTAWARPSCRPTSRITPFWRTDLLRLHAATGDARWLKEARALTDRMIADFEDREEGGFFFTALGHESLLARAKDPFDNALPSGNSMAILDLLALYRATGESSYRDHAGKALDAFSSSLSQVPGAMPAVVVGLEQYLDSRPERLAVSRQPRARSTTSPSRIVTASARPAGGTPATIAPGREWDAVVTVEIQQAGTSTPIRPDLPR